MSAGLDPGTADRLWNFSGLLAVVGLDPPSAKAVYVIRGIRGVTATSGNPPINSIEFSGHAHVCLYKRPSFVSGFCMLIAVNDATLLSMTTMMKSSQDVLVDDILNDQNKDGLDTKHVEDYDRPQVIEGVDVVVPVSHFATMSRPQTFRTFWRVSSFILLIQ